jgi:polysaccharide export outer membrane protein
MLRAFCTTFLCICLACGFSAYADENQHDQHGSLAYKVEASDVLAISVWDEPELAREVIVMPDMTISFPLVGVVNVADADIKTIAEEIKIGLSKYIPEAAVHVAVVQIRGSRFSVVGKVNRPGEFPLDKGTTVLHALSAAGGLKTFGDKSGIKVIRFNGQEQDAIGVDYGKLLKGKGLQSNISLQAGDIVVVP